MVCIMSVSFGIGVVCVFNDNDVVSFWACLISTIYTHSHTSPKQIYTATLNVSNPLWCVIN